MRIPNIRPMEIVWRNIFDSFSVHAECGGKSNCVATHPESLGNRFRLSVDGKCHWFGRPRSLLIPIQCFPNIAPRFRQNYTLHRVSGMSLMIYRKMPVVPRIVLPG